MVLSFLATSVHLAFDAITYISFTLIHTPSVSIRSDPQTHSSFPSAHRQSLPTVFVRTQAFLELGRLYRARGALAEAAQAVLYALDLEESAPLRPFGILAVRL